MPQSKSKLAAYMRERRAAAQRKAKLGRALASIQREQQFGLRRPITLPRVAWMEKSSRAETKPAASG